MLELPSRVFITGTDTDVGKTVISAMLTIGLRAAYWKPIQAGMEPSTDTFWIKQVTQLPDDHFFEERFKLTHPMSPHAAAKLDGIKISLNDFELPDPVHSRRLIIEGAGGIMVPLNDKDLVLDLIKHLELPVILVARSTLGTINHTLLSLSKLKQEGVPVLGVVMNGPKNESNRKAIEHYGQTSVIAEIETLQEITPESLLESFTRNFEKTI